MPKSSKIWRLLTESLHGYDYFISYSWSGSSTYAPALCQALQQKGLRCFLDRSPEGFTAGGEWKAETQRAIRTSSALIAIVEPHAFRSHYVPYEVALFLSLGRLIIPIDVEGTLWRARHDPDFAAALGQTPESAKMLESLIDRIGPSESSTAGTAIPTNEVVDKLVQSFTYTKRMIRLTRVYAASAAVFAVLAAIAVVLFLLENLARNEAERKTRYADGQRLAVISASERNTHPLRSILLASEAVLRTVRAGEPPVPAAEQALRDVLGQVGNAAIPIEGEVESVDFRPEGLRVVTDVEPRGHEVCIVTDQGDGRLTSSPSKAVDWYGEPIYAVGGAVVTRSPEGILRSRLMGGKQVPNGGNFIEIDGKRVPGDSAALSAHDDRHFVVDRNDGTLYVFDSRDISAPPRQLRLPPRKPLAPDLIEREQLSPDGRLLAAWVGRTNIVVWDIEHADAKPDVLPASGVNQILFAPDGRLLAACDGRAVTDPCILVWGPSRPYRDPNVLRIAKGSGQMLNLHLSPNGRWLVSDGHYYENTDASGFHLWDMKNLALKPVRLGVPGRQVVFDRDGTRLAIEADSTVHVIYPHSPKHRLTLRGHDRHILFMAFSPDGDRLVTKAYTDPLRIWHLDNPVAQPVRLLGNPNRLESVALRRQAGESLRGVDSYGATWIWDFNRPAPQPTIVKAPDEKPMSVMVSQDGRWSAMGRRNGKVSVRDLDCPTCNEIVLEANGANVSCLAFSADSRHLLTAGLDRVVWDADPCDAMGRDMIVGGVTVIKIWNLAALSAKPLELAPAESSVSEMVMSPDGKTVVASLMNNSVFAWTLSAPAAVPRRLFDNGNTSPVDLAISPKGAWLFVSPHGKRIQYWALNALDRKPSQLNDNETTSRVLAFSQDGSRMVTSGAKDVTRVWNTRNLSHACAVLSYASDNHAAFLGDSRSLLITGERVWKLDDLGSGPITLQGLRPWFKNPLLFKDGGRMVIANTEDGRVGVWDLRVEGLLELARRACGRNLSLEEWQRYFGGEKYRPTFLGLPLPAYDESYASTAQNLTPAEWRSFFGNEPYRETFRSRGKVSSNTSGH